MFCKNCGHQIHEGVKFCGGCGTPTISEIKEVPTKHGPAQTDDIIDLSNQREDALPREKRYLPLVFTALMIIPVWIAFSFIGNFIYNSGFVSGDSPIPAMLIISLPCSAFSFVLLLWARKKGKSTTRKTGAGASFMFYMCSVFGAGLALTAGFAEHFASLSIVGIIAWSMFAAFSLTFLVFSVTASNTIGEEGLYSLAKAIFAGFLISPLSAMLLGTVFAILEKIIIFVIIGFVLFFLLGGRIIFYRNN